MAEAKAGDSNSAGSGLGIGEISENFSHEVAIQASVLEEIPIHYFDFYGALLEYIGRNQLVSYVSKLKILGSTELKKLTKIELINFLKNSKIFPIEIVPRNKIISYIMTMKIHDFKEIKKLTKIELIKLLEYKETFFDFEDSYFDYEDEKFSCSICLDSIDPISDAHITKRLYCCRNFFHINCLKSWAEIEDIGYSYSSCEITRFELFFTCPMCRKLHRELLVLKF